MRSEKVSARHQPAARIRSGIPRRVEILLALIGLVITAPFFALAMIAIFITSGSPVFFRQQRVGRDGKLFTLIKLRTMRPNRQGIQVTASGDNRITAVGKVLRLTKLDELPELWNVLRGDMSLVGPRPEVPRYVNLGDPAWRVVLAARPGITDPMTLRLRNEEALLAEVESDRESFYLQTLQPFKLHGYLQYLQHRSAWFDVEILFKTVLAVALPGHAATPSVVELVAFNSSRAGGQNLAAGEFSNR